MGLETDSELDEWPDPEDTVSYGHPPGPMEGMETEDEKIPP